MLGFALAEGGRRTFLGALRDIWQSIVDRLPYLLAAALVFLVFFAVAVILRRAMRAFGSRSRMHLNLAELLARLVSFLTILLGLLVAAVVAFPSFKPGDLLAGLGITSVAIGFAFKDILQNFFAGVLILWRQPFQVGDEVKSGDYEGVVEEINTRSTRVRTYDGERAVLPNGEVYTNAILVRTAYEKRRARFKVGVGYGDELELARRTIMEAVVATEGVLGDPGPWVYLVNLAPSAVEFEVFFWCHPKQANLLAVRDAAITGVKKALDRAKIDMPYPHAVLLFPPDQDSRIERKAS